MQLGMIGLGKMGGNMKKRLEDRGHEVIGYDRDPDISDSRDLADLISRLEAPRAVWVMVPAGEATRSTIEQLGDLLSDGDVVVDGGNSRFSDDQPHAELLAKRNIGFVDAGVSGGVWGLANGYALMVGGATNHVRHLMPIFDALKPEGEYGFVHAGGVGAGHYAKMVHNGIEYGMMQAYAEGYALMEASEAVTDVPAVVKSWRDGTVIRSWLLDLLDRALEDDPELNELRGWVDDSGEGRWTVEEAIRLRVALPAITESLFARYTSRDPDSDTMKAVAALRQQFGGHAVKPE
ncbi:phosphogluconate dehydrogenase (NAD(+)-dependent, decarboxylating) [Haloglycomyces albus]|uniref:phosphogluconate dehydrogenase (NAD(+)-dependent, decarboxylating) n=1 Tax=Haloglycomyces albus TaxID=526067 RepID=UPI00046CA577|nr:decarboxylating 6-phosphogluconate dehydrogenase [Haloglycomyces albus]